MNHILFRRKFESNGDVDTLGSMKDSKAHIRYDHCQLWSEDLCEAITYTTYITPEDVHAPVFLDKHEEHQHFTVFIDGIIDNRKELHEHFGFSGELLKDIDYVLEAYARYNKDVGRYLIGDYVLIIMDWLTKETYIFRDPMGKRLLYYWIDENELLIASRLEMINNHKHLGLDDQWLNEYIALDGVNQYMDSNRTPIANVSLLEPGTYIKWQSVNKKLTERFWSLNQIKKRRFVKRKDAYNEFMTLFYRVIEDRLRVDGNIGLMLSSGLDSVSIASILEEICEGRKIFSYTWKPKYEMSLQDGYILGDESNIVEALGSEFSHIDMHIDDCSNAHPLDEIERLTAVYEQPYKLVKNIYWVDYLHKEAALNNCKVMLSGQFGNSTISYGEWFNLSQIHLKKHRYIRWFLYLNKFGKAAGIGRKRLMLSGLSSYLRSIPRRIPLNRYGTVKEDNIKDIIDKYVKLDIPKSIKCHRDYLRYTLSSNMINQIGVMEAKLASSHGMVDRDPTMDIRLVEFLLSMPERFFEKGAIDRAYVRVGLRDKIPEGVRDNLWFRGQQSSDWLNRIIEKKDRLKEEIEDLEHYMSVDQSFDWSNNKRIIKDLANKSIDDVDEADIRELICWIVTNKYIKKESKEVEV